MKSDSPAVEVTFRWPSICLFENRGSLQNLIILDRVKDRAEALTRQISSSDSLRLDEDLGSVREIETRIEAMRKSLEKAQDAAKGQNRPVFSMERPGNGMPDTVLVKELDLPKRGKYPDGPLDSASGRGYFPSELHGIDVIVKDSKRFASTNKWGLGFYLWTSGTSL